MIEIRIREVNEIISNDEYEGRPIIYTTGAYLSPKKFRKENGEIMWGWIVERFEDDSFFDGVSFNPDEYAETKVELCKNRDIEYEPIAAKEELPE